MTTEPTPLDEQKQSAIRSISDSIGKHQFVKREGIGFTCRDHVCASKGTIFLTLKDRYDHQALVAVNDLLSSLRWDRGYDLEDAGVPEEDREKDFTYSLLTDILDAVPAGRSYADRRARQEATAVRSAMEAAEADSDAFGPARAEMFNHLQERYAVSGKDNR
jgi:hypothetical protein